MTGPDLSASMEKYRKRALGYGDSAHLFCSA